MPSFFSCTRFRSIIELSRHREETLYLHFNFGGTIGAEIGCGFEDSFDEIFSEEELSGAVGCGELQISLAKFSFSLEYLD